MNFPYSYWTESQSPFFGIPTSGDRNSAPTILNLNGLLAYYAFENANLGYDSTRNYDLTTNGTISAVAGVLGNGLDETVPGGYLSLADTANFRMTNSRTLAFWANLGGSASLGSSYNASLFAKSGGSSLFEWFVITDGGSNVSFKIYYGGGFNNVTSTVTATLNAWHFYVCWYDAFANTVNIQLDNGPVVSNSMGSNVPTTSNGSFIFKFGGGDDTPNTLYDEVSFWGRILGSVERSTLYNNGIGTTWPFLTYPII